jgi:hypothetical protein
MSKAKIIELAEERYNADWLRSVSEEQAVRALPMKKGSQVRNAWKQANGLSVRNYAKKRKKSDSNAKKS